MAGALLGATLACAPDGPSASVLATARADVALNSPLVVELDGPVDPLSVHPGSVWAQDDSGRRLRAVASTAAGRIIVLLEVDAALLAAPPAAVHVRLQGLPSSRALSTLDGRRLGAPAERVFRASPALEVVGPSPPRLVELSGQPPAGAMRLTPDGPLSLVFDGVLDPLTLRPEDSPLYPVQEGLVLAAPLRPATEWSCVGSRFVLRLDPASASGTYRLDLRRVGWRDLAGALPEPALVADVVLP